MRGGGTFVELKVFAEHAQQMLFQTHHQRMHPGVKQDVGTFKTHLRRIAGREVLHMDRGRDDGAGQSQALGNVAFHLSAQNQLGLQGTYLLFDLQVVVGDQGLHAIQLGGVAQLAREFPAVGAHAHHLEAHFLVGNACSGHDVRGVAKQEHALAGEVGGVHRACVPVRVQMLFQASRHGHACQGGDFGHEGTRGTDAHGHGLGEGLLELALQPLGGGARDFGVEQDVEVGLRQVLQVFHGGVERGDDGHLDAHGRQQLADFAHIVAMAKAQGRGTEDVATRLAISSLRRGHLGADQATGKLVEGF